jgi:hypothetical protein
VLSRIPCKSASEVHVVKQLALECHPSFAPYCRDEGAKFTLDHTVPFSMVGKVVYRCDLPAQYQELPPLQSLFPPGGGGGHCPGGPPPADGLGDVEGDIGPCDVHGVGDMPVAHGSAGASGGPSRGGGGPPPSDAPDGGGGGDPGSRKVWFPNRRRLNVARS